MICPECGTRLAAGTRECHFCGYSHPDDEIPITNLGNIATDNHSQTTPIYSNLPDHHSINPDERNNDPANALSGNTSNIRSWTLFDFVRYNAPLFTVIGITGTMISLIPTFLEKIIGLDWKILLIRDYLGLFLLFLIQILFTSGGILILLIAVLILWNLIRCNINPETIHQIHGQNITKGTLQKILFLLVFLPTIGAFIYFIMPIFLFQTDPYCKFFEIIIFSVYLLLIMYLFLFLSILNSPITPQIKTILSIVLSLIIFAGLAWFSWTITLPLLGQFSPTENLTNNETEIITNSLSYSISNSTTIGIPLQGGGNVTMSDIDKKYYLNAAWSTNFGFFIICDPNTHITKIAGPEITINNGYSTLFWTYDPKYQGIKKPPVSIFLTVTNIRKNEIVGVSQKNITWSDLDTANVNP